MKIIPHYQYYYHTNKIWYCLYTKYCIIHRRYRTCLDII